MDLAIQLDAAALEERGQLKELRYFRQAGEIRLNDMVLIEDDAPAIGKPKGAEDRCWFERLHRGVMIRKDLILDDPRAFSGYLVFNGYEAEDNEHPLHIRLNGHDLVRSPTQYAHPFARQYYTTDWGGAHFDNWFFVEIPVGMLGEGRNEILLWAESDDTSWEIMVASDAEYERGSTTRLRHPDRSAKSRDGGITWDFERLGWKDELDGEYAIRLSLDRYVPEGEYVSPVIDLAEAWGVDAIKKQVVLETCRLEWDIGTPEGSSSEILVRFGENPVPSGDSWTPYESVDGQVLEASRPAGRFLQFRAVLRAENPLTTPVLRGLSAESTFEETGPTSGPVCRVVEFRNRRVIRSSVAFVHEDYARLREYRERFELDAVVADAATEFEAQLSLLRWAYEIPLKGLDPYAWNFYDLPALERDAGGEIVRRREYKTRRRDHHCLYSNLAFVGACLSLGFPARWVNIATRTTYGHEVSEFWSNDLDKWVFADATRDYTICDPDTGIPLSLTEISERLKAIVGQEADWEYPIRWQVPDLRETYRVNVAYREGDHRFKVSDADHGPHLLLFKGQLRTPFRNDFASRPQPVPWRVSSNWGGDQLYGYYNDTFPRKREYQHHTDRWQDFNPVLNRCELTLSETGDPGTIKVDVDTETPCFDSFVVQRDEGDVETEAGPSFEWNLHEGLNHLRIRARNTAGVLGPESSVSVMMVMGGLSRPGGAGEPEGRIGWATIS